MTARNTRERQPTESSGSSTVECHCKEHGRYTAQTVTGPGGKVIRMACPMCMAEWENSQRAEEQAKIDAVRGELVKTSGIPGRFAVKGFGGYDTSGGLDRDHALRVARTYAERFGEHRKTGCSLVFCGRPGTGKTHLACAILRTVIQGRGVRGNYTTAFRAIQQTKESYAKRTEKSERQVLASFQAPALLVIDEVGVQHGTEIDKLILYQVIKGRYEQVKPTILISNFPEGELADFIGIRCMDRLREGGGAVVAFNWESYRK